MSRDSAERLVLFDYWRSSAAYRVRIALNLKGLDYEQRAVNLVHGDGEHRSAQYRAINPQQLVPTLLHRGRALTQSLAICTYLDQLFPTPLLVPSDPVAGARVRALALLIACDIHPINNLRVQRYLKAELGAGETAVSDWMQHWMTVGFSALEAMLAGSEETGRFCQGDQPGLADCCLVPQVYNAERFGCDLSGFPMIRAIAAHCREQPAFAAAAPECQPDAVPA